LYLRRRLSVEGKKKRQSLLYLIGSPTSGAAENGKTGKSRDPDPAPTHDKKQERLTVHRSVNIAPFLRIASGSPSIILIRVRRMDDQLSRDRIKELGNFSFCHFLDRLVLPFGLLILVNQKRSNTFLKVALARL